MLKELFDAIGRQATEAVGARILDKDPEPDHLYWMDDGEGNLTLHEAKPAPRKHVAFNLQAIVEFAKRDLSQSSVWYSRKGVVCLLDDGTRRDRVALELEYSPQLKAFGSLGTGKSFSQREAVLFLRTTFKDCMSSCPTLVGILRGIKFSLADDGNSIVEHGKRSVGRKIEQEITGAGVLPEYVTLTIPVFASAFAFREQVEMALEPDPSSQSFQFIPISGAIETAVASAEDRIGGQLAELLGEDGRLYYGQP